MSPYCDKEGILIVAADTIVVIDGGVLGKPAGKDESVHMLKRLQGRTHEVLTGVSVIGKGKILSAMERTKVNFRALGDDAIRAYAETGEGSDKAGAYAIQGKGSLLVASIEGDYFNVVGLPLCRLSLMIGEMGFSLAVQLQ
jgi:septum formation protein